MPNTNEYDDLIISINAKHDRYDVASEQRIQDPNSGQEERIPLTVPPRPFNAQPFLERLPEVKHAIHSAIQDRSNDDDLLKAYGRDLFDEVFQDRVQQELVGPLSTARGKNYRLRIRLDLPKKLQALPWELLCRTDRPPNDYLCLNDGLELVRSAKRLQAAQPPTINLPLRILIVVSTPFDQVPIQARDEIQRMLGVLSDLIQDGMVQVDFVHGPSTWDRIDAFLRNNQFHILHFIGHGTLENDKGVLFFEDRSRMQQPVSSIDLYRLLGGPNHPQLIILSACEGAASGGTEFTDFSNSFASVADGLVQQGIPAVIAHQFIISDDAATQITNEVYQKLYDGFGVDEAISSVRRSFSMRSAVPSQIERFTPVVFLNSPHGKLFDIAQREGMPRQDCFELMRQRAGVSEQNSFCSEALDYARTARIIDASDDGNVKMEERMARAEQLDTALHMSEYCKSQEHWPGMLNALDDYLQLFSDVLDDAQKKKRRREYDRIRDRKAVLEVGIGSRDPMFAWKE